MSKAKYQLIPLQTPRYTQNYRDTWARLCNCSKQTMEDTCVHWTVRYLERSPSILLQILLDMHGSKSNWKRVIIVCLTFLYGCPQR